MVCNGVIGVDTGALQVYLFVPEREQIYDMYEQICGARMTTNMGRIGGFERDFTPKFHELLKIS
jgi:NADH-quinone oxidoreductase subunit D